MNKYIYKKTIFVLSWILVAIWMIVIYNFSAKPAEQSDELSKKAAEVIIETIEKVNLIEIDTNRVNLIDQYNHIVRKYAHACVYFILGLLTYNAFRMSNQNSFKVFTYSFLLCFGYAISDESHQLFVFGRSGQATDVLIDLTGAIIGISIFAFAVKKGGSF